jgi:hypothetical protein
MGYTKIWTPPSIPLRDNLPAWKAICNDIHENILAAGLVQTNTPGQLVIGSVSALPADNTYAGFIEYALDDDWQAGLPVVLKLSFGCGMEGLHANVSPLPARTRTLHIKLSVIVNGIVAENIGCPQSYYNSNSTVTSQLTSTGFSAFCYNKNRGFLGLFYGVGSRNKPFAHTNGSYYSGSLCIAIQRELDTENNPTSAGIAFCSNMYKSWGDTSIIWPSTYDSSYTYYYGSGINSNHNRISYRQGRAGYSTTGTKILIEPINYPKLVPTPFPYLYSYRNTDITATAQFTMKAITGEEHNFIALGNETGFIPDMLDMGNAGLCMLFE